MYRENRRVTVARWLRGWRYQEFRVAVPLPVDLARDRLASAVVARPRVAGKLPGAWFVHGYLHEDEFRLRVTRPRSGRPGLRPVLRGRIAATADGCELRCGVGASRQDQTAAGVGLVCGGLVLLLGLYSVLTGLLTGDAADVRIGLVLGGIGLVAGLVAAASVQAVRLIHRTDSAYFRAWLTEVMAGDDDRRPAAGLLPVPGREPPADCRRPASNSPA